MKKVFFTGYRTTNQDKAKGRNNVTVLRRIILAIQPQTTKKK